MTKVALFSDLHGHPFKPYATVLENGMNSRLADAVSCIEQVVQHCVKEDVDLVLFGGDLFHVRRTINVAAFNAVYEAMAKFSVHGIPLVMIHGNHDQADRAGTQHSVHAFRTFCNVVDDPGWMMVSGKSGEPYAIMAVPYMENVEQLRQVVTTPCPMSKVPKLMLAHLGIQGAKVGSDFVYINPHDAGVEDLNCEAFDAVYLGHYHLHQQIAPNAWYIGAPLQHNWGDRDQWRGFLIYDAEAKTHRKIPLKAPKFVEVADWAPDFETIDTDDCYVRLVSRDVWTEQRIDEMREILACRSLEIAAPKEKKSTKAEPRIEVKPGASFSEIMGQYVRSGVHATHGLDDDYLMQIGREILDEVAE